MTRRDSNLQSQQASGKRPTPHRAANGIGLCMYVHMYVRMYECMPVCMYIQSCVAERRGYLLRNASLGDFVVVRT